MLLLLLLLLLLSSFNRVRLWVTPETAAHQAPPSLGFSRQEHWNGLPFPSTMHESEKWKWSCSVMSDSLRLHGLQPIRLLRPWDFPGKNTGVGCRKCFYIMYPHPQGEKLRTFPKLWTIVIDIPGNKTYLGIKKWWFIPDFCSPVDSLQLYVSYSFLACILKYFVSLLLCSL